MRFAIVMTLVLAGCTQTAPEAGIVTGSLPDRAQPGTSEASKGQAVSDANWEQLRPLLRDYIDCNLKNASKLAQQPDSVEHLAQKANTLCAPEHERAKEKFASLFNADRASLFGEEIKARARDTVVSQISKVRLSTARGDQQTKPPETLPPPKKGGKES